MSKNNGMDSQDRDVPSHKSCQKNIFIFFKSHSLHLLFFRFSFNLGFAEIGNWLGQLLSLFVFTTCHMTAELINHRNKEVFLNSQKPQAQLRLLWSAFSLGIIKGFPVKQRLYPSTQWLSSWQCFDLIFYSQVILFHLLQTFLHTRLRAVIHRQAKHWNVPKGTDEGKLGY